MTFLSLILVLVLTACHSSKESTQPTTTTNVNSSAEPNTTQSAISYPEQPIQMVVPYAAGGNTDLVARALATYADKYLDQPISVINVPGGGAVIGMTEVYNAKADGYKIAMATNGPLTLKTHTDASYSYDDFVPIIQVTEIPIALAVAKQAPYDTFEEWLQWVKNNPEKFQYGTPGAGLTQHITMEAIQKELDIKNIHVPYTSGAEAITATVGGHTDGVFTQLSEILPYTKNGELKLLFISSKDRNASVPDVPTLAELGVDIVTGAWTGVVAPKGTPEEVISILHDAFKNVLEDEGFIEQLHNLGADVAYLNSSDWAEKISAEYKKNGEILEAIGLIN